MAMAPKAEIPLYHQNRLSRSASSRRRRASAPKKRNGSGTCCNTWNVLLVSPLVLLAFALGTFVGIELAQAPGGEGTGLHNGKSWPVCCDVRARARVCGQESVAREAWVGCDVGLAPLGETAANRRVAHGMCVWCGLLFTTIFSDRRHGSGLSERAPKNLDACGRRGGSLFCWGWDLTTTNGFGCWVHVGMKFRRKPSCRNKSGNGERSYLRLPNTHVGPR